MVARCSSGMNLGVLQMVLLPRSFSLSRTLKGTTSLEDYLSKCAAPKPVAKWWPLFKRHNYVPHSKTNLLTSQYSGHPWRRECFSCQSWGPEQLIKGLARVFNSEEDQVGFSDKPVIAYLVQKACSSDEQRRKLADSNFRCWDAIKTMKKENVCFFCQPRCQYPLINLSAKSTLIHVGHHQFKVK